MSDTVVPSPTPRDGRLDVLRGLCLLNMVIVHALHEGLAAPGWLNEITMNWLRFAAGGFIFASGLCIGAIHYRKALDPARRPSIYLSLVRRAGLVLLVHYCATLLSLTLVPMRGYYAYDTTTYVWDVLLFRTGYELLLFYVVMLLATPVLIELTRRCGALAVLLGSGALFFVAYDKPYFGLYAIEMYFPVIRWQVLFVIGLLAGSKLPAFDALSISAKRRLLVGAASVAIGIAGFHALQRSGLAVPWWLAVSKFPLSPLEVVRYVSLVIAIGVSVDLLWHRIAGTRGQKIVQLLGANSLLLWVAHVPIVSNVVALNWVLALALAYAGVWIAASVATWLSQRWDGSMPTLPRLPYAAPVIGSLAAVAVLVNLQGRAHFADDNTALVEATVADAHLDDEEIPDVIFGDDIPDEFLEATFDEQT